MALKAFVKSLDDLDEKYHDLYEEAPDGTGYVLILDDSDFKKKIAEFRTNNIALQKAKTDLETQMSKFKDVDPEKYKEMQGRMKELEKLEEQKLLDEGEIDQIVQKRTENMRRDHEAQLRAKDEALASQREETNQLRSSLGVAVIDTAVQNAVNKVGKPRAGAMPDIIARARAMWKIDENGHPRPQNAAGELVYGSSGDALTFEEWAANLMQEAPHLFESGSGGGSGGGDKGSGRPAGATVVKKGDHKSFQDNLEQIAKGKVKVTSGD